MTTATMYAEDVLEDMGYDVETDSGDAGVVGFGYQPGVVYTQHVPEITDRDHSHEHYTPTR